MSHSNKKLNEKNSPDLLIDQQQLVSIQNINDSSINMQSVSGQQAIIPQASPQQVQTVSGTAMTQVMTQGPQTAPSPHGVATNLPLPPQSAQFYVQATGMPGPPAIAPAPGPQATTTTVSALHQPLQHQLAPQPLNHPGVSQSPMPQLQPQVQVIQSGIPGGSYFHQVYQNAQGQLIMPSNLTLQPAPGMNPTQIQPGTLNPINSSIQVISTGKPFQGQITPHMLAAAGGKGVLQAGNQTGYNPSNIPTSGSQAVLISQLGGNPTLGVISQPPNILPAQSAGPKPGEMQKVSNMPAAFGQLQQGLTWAAPGTIHSPTLLTAQNSPIFIRGGQPGQENVFIQNPQAMVPTNSMVNPAIASMSAATHQKSRTGMELQANIQPKGPVMRPAILPSVTTGQLRPGASVSTQTAAGQTIAPHLGPRSQSGKMRGKNAISRAPPPIAMQQQQLIQAPQMMQQTLGGMAVGPPMAMGTVQPSVAMVSVTSMNVNQTHGKPITVSANLQPTKPLATIPAGSVLQPNIMGPVQNIVLNKMGQMQPPMATTLPIQSQIQPQPTIIPMSQAAIPLIHPPVAPADPQPTGYQHVVPLGQPQVQAVHPQGIVPLSVSTSSSQADSERIETKITERLAPPTSVANIAVTAESTKQQTNNNINSTPDQNDSKKPKLMLNGVTPEKTTTTTNTGPPKAMIKPQVLTHVIEGFVIQEASEAFPISRAARITDSGKMRSNNSSNLATVAPQAPHDKENINDDLVKRDLTTASKDMMQCEACGKFDSRCKFKKFKRFCSAACNKKYISGNVNKRTGDFLDHDPKRLKDDSVTSDGVKSAAQLTFEPGMNVDQEQSNSNEDGMDEGKIPRCDILRWTVQEVVDFIRNLPGCQDYAEDFELQEIDGQALMLLKADHLMSAMSIKLGPALKICDKIEAMRSDKKET